MTVHRPDRAYCAPCWGSCQRPEGSRVVAALVFLVLLVLGGLAGVR